MGLSQLINIDTTSNKVIEYQKKIQNLVEQLNHLNIDDYQSQVHGIVQQIKTMDQQFLADLGLSIKGHVLFSRHGESSNWDQKKLGLNPNAPLAEQAIVNMSQTNQMTMGLLHYPNQPVHIAVSPLVRAKQTASLVIPQGLKSAQIIIQPALSENSYTPSGSNITSLEQMKNEYQQMSFWKTPLKVIIYALSILFFGYPEVFKQIQEKSTQTDNLMLQIPGVDEETYYSQGEANLNDGTYYFDTNISDVQKAEKTRRLIRDNLKSGENDYWMFGHGKNFQLFFDETFGITSEFEYGETRSVYNVQKEPGSTSLFNPPYTFVIDQNTGQIRGKFTEKMLTLEKNPWTLTVVGGSTRTMYEKGLELSVPQPTVSHQQERTKSTELLHTNSPLSTKVSDKTNENPDAPSPTI
ncbi:phosphoglycerate mutase family protein [Legionella fallonii]|uniref:Uncharacterized protein n=1 Tax=Legionella fallonii LLAP-10 TaxID=1212491 RepID=A0A098GAQ0_9GAMM|nr:phosphoglycerate mutase family protein [Legionella fallonii]CEG58560.1 protein of unknown function [Legionella fallonii LLAP-10]